MSESPQTVLILLSNLTQRDPLQKFAIKGMIMFRDFLILDSSKDIHCVHWCRFIRESSFHMTRGDKDIEGGALKIFRHPKGEAPKICILQNQREGGAPKKLSH